MLFEKNSINPEYSIFRNPFFWVFFFAISIISAAACYKYLSKALPLLDIQITMSKQQALSMSKEIAQKYNLGPKNFLQSGYFNTDYQTQYYVELEMGGNKAFEQLILEKNYYPFTWQVRHFNEGINNEALIIFTPDGKPYGFVEHISENEPGDSLNQEDAKKLAQKFLIDWEPNLNDYNLVSASNETRSSGRVDHTFTYEKNNITLGSSHYRLSIIVSGNKVSTLNHFIDIPESFSRRYNQMRSTNETISAIANGIIYIIYLIFGCLFSILFLLKKNWLLPRPALIMGTLIATAHIVTELNHLPLIWFSYDTAIPANAFLIQRILGILLMFFLWTAVYSCSIMAAEGLSRMAFGTHVQFWKIWNPRVSSTYTMYGKTIGSYLFLAFDFAFIVLFYALGTTMFGWWSPSTAITNPNILGTYAPGLGALSQALAAGFWEECLFRAVPISISALIGQKYGKRNMGIIFGLIMQAIIFGAAHAKYPTLPGYVRLIELIIPSLSFGFVFLRFGLFPAIIIHFLYDAILFALPLFITTTPEMFIQKLIVILGLIIPIIIILFARLKHKSLNNIDKEFYNSSWQPQNYIEAAGHASNEIIEKPVSFEFEKFGKQTKFLITILGITGLFFWCNSIRLKSEVPPLVLTKKEAINIAKQKLEKKNVSTQQWIILPSYYPQKQEIAALTEDYILQNGGTSLYHKLIGNYLVAPQWNIRFAKFDGDINKKAEQYNVYVNSNGQIRRIKHTLLDSDPGATLTKEDARIIALALIKEQYNLEINQLKELCAVCNKQLARLDWIFIFSTVQIIEPLDKDQTRLMVQIAGDKIVDFNKFIHLPEEWMRKQRNKNSMWHIIEIIRMFSFFIILFIAGLQALNLWLKNIFPIRSSFWMALIFGLILLLQRLSNWPEVWASMNTSQPIITQLINSEIMLLVSVAIECIIIALLFGVIVNYFSNKRTLYSASNPVYFKRLPFAILLGCLYAGIFAFINNSIYTNNLRTPNFAGAGSLIPWISFIASYLIPYLKHTLQLTFISIYASKNSIFGYLAMFILSTLVITPINTSADITQWLISFALIFVINIIIYKLILRFDLLLIPYIVATNTLLTLIPEITAHIYPGSSIAALITFVAISLTAAVLVKILRNGKLSLYADQTDKNDKITIKA